MSSSKTSTETIARRAIIAGLVQGVGYRMSLAAQARELNINGWCRNLPTGEVEAWMQGQAESVRLLLDWIHQGPPAARVDHVRIEPQAILEPMLGESIQTFEIRS